MKRIYVAGPLTPKGNNGNPAIEYLMNIRRMVRTSLELIKEGFSPYCPGLDYHLFLQQSDQEVNEDVLNEEVIKDFSMDWLRVCEGILLVGDWESSSGTLAEIKEARRLHIPIFMNVNEIIKYKEDHI